MILEKVVTHLNIIEPKRAGYKERAAYIVQISPVKIRLVLASLARGCGRAKRTRL